jgi:Transglutaminase-like superfamily/TgpA N-terminal domain
MTLRERAETLLDRATPVEGWVTVALVALLSVTLAWSIDDVGLVLGRGDFTDFLAPMALAGAAVGFVGVKVGWGRWTIYLVGSIFAALVVPIFVGGMLAAPVNPGQAFHATASSVVQAVTDLVVLDLPFTTEYGHYLLVLGLLVWATSMFASYAVFGHRRPMNAIAIVGVVLIVNMALTTNDQLRLLVLFTIVSLLLLMRAHVLDEQGEWLRRRVGDPASLSSMYLRGGAIFVVAAVVGSLVLTNTAKSAPLQGVWSDFSGTLVELSRSIQKFLPVGGSSVSFGADFDPAGTSIRGIWNPGNELELSIQLPPGDKTAYYWRAVTWDQFTGTGWKTSDTAKLKVDAGKPLLDGSDDDPDPTITKAVTFEVTPGRQTSTVFSPLTPVSVDQPTTVNVIGDAERLGSIQRIGSGPYSVTAMIPITGDQPGQVNAAALEAAGGDYPDDILQLYTAVPEGAIPAGGKAEGLLDQFVAESRQGINDLNPYDFAQLLQSRFRDSGPNKIFTYDTNVLDLFTGDCNNLSTVECFATYRRGFCQFYATTMAIFLREEGIPARVVEGFLPSTAAKDGTVIIGNSQSHQWVEVYFPGYGWITFDPTGGGVSSQLAAIPTGKPTGSQGPRATPKATVKDQPGGSAGVRPGQINEGDPSLRATTNRGPFIALAILLAVIMAAVVFAVWQRGPRGQVTADRAYGTVTRLAARFGFAPRPTQTVYEYAGSLGELLPGARPELETVAHAKVESTYGRAILADDRIRALRNAERRLRVRLLRLAFRRPRRLRRRR